MVRKTSDIDCIESKKAFEKILEDLSKQPLGQFQSGDKNPKKEILTPGKLSSVGFLDEDQELEEIIEKDRKTIEIMGVNRTYILALLLHMILWSKKGYSNDENKHLYIAPNGRFYKLIAYKYNDIPQDCPWRTVKGECNKENVNTEYILYDIKEGKSLFNNLPEPIMVVSELLPHLIESHEFFEGGGYRISPEVIVEILGGIAPDKIKEAKNLKI